MTTATGTQIRLSNMRELFGQAETLLSNHWREAAQHREGAEFAPDKDRYYAIEDAGALFALAAVDGDEIVGHSINFVTTDLRCGKVLCLNDGLTVAKTHRGRGLGRELIVATEVEASLRGAYPPRFDAGQGSHMEALLRKMGYVALATSYSREIV